MTKTNYIYDVKCDLIIPTYNLKINIHQNSNRYNIFVGPHSAYDFEFSVGPSHIQWIKDWWDEVYKDLMGQVGDYKRDIHIEIGALMLRCFIKNISFNTDGSAQVEISSDYFEKVDFNPILSQRRDYAIDQILNM